MENFKLDLTKLTPVAEKDRVKGNWYVVCDDMIQDVTYYTRWHSRDSQMVISGAIGASWSHWFAIPPNLPGFPGATIPDQISLPLSEWAYSYNQDVIVLHRKKYVETLVLPAGTIEERRKRLQEELESLEK